MKKIISFVVSFTIVICLLMTGCDSTKEIENIKLSETQLELEPGKNQEIKAEFLPEDATETRLTWESSDYTVANVVNGTVYAIADGNATIIVTADSWVTATCTVKVHTPSAYSKLNDDERSFYYSFVGYDSLGEEGVISQFYDPSSVSIISIDEYTFDDWNKLDDGYIVEISAKNRVGGVSKETYLLYTQVLPMKTVLEETYKTATSSSKFNVQRINEAIKEYIKEQGW